jgi:hypothetical protein
MKLLGVLMVVLEIMMMIATMTAITNIIKRIIPIH